MKTKKIKHSEYCLETNQGFGKSEGFTCVDNCRDKAKRIPCSNVDCPEGKAGGYDSKTCSVHCHDAYESQLMDRKPQHTPTPWILKNLEGSGLPFVASKSGYAVADTGLSSVNAQEAEANAAFIVRAVNAHDQMLKVLEILVGELPELDSPDEPLEGTIAVDVLARRWSQIKAAISKAKGK